jgi:hypothetical protein
VAYFCIAQLPEADAMNYSNASTDDSGFPAVFVVLSTFIGALVWLFVLLAALGQ